MIRIWLRGQLHRRVGRLLLAATGVAIAVSLLASLGAFLAASKATMTSRATGSVAVDWQVQVAVGADPAAVRATVAKANGVKLALPISFAQVAGFQATSAGTTQTTGAGVVIGLPEGYRAAFPGQIRSLAGPMAGVLLAQQTAANLHVVPGDTVQIQLAVGRALSVVIAGVVDLPQANSLFQRVGAPAQSQPTAPPDNVLLVPSADFAKWFAGLATSRPDLITEQIHVRRMPDLPPDPAAAYGVATSQAHNLEAQLAGAGQVGNNLAAALDGARKDALYAQVLFLFLGLPGAVLAALLTVAVVAAGATRRRRDEAVLRTRGASIRQLVTLASVEALLVGVLGGVIGLLTAQVMGRWAFASSSFGATSGQALGWTSAAFMVGVAIALTAILVPTLRDARHTTVAGARVAFRRARAPWWMRFGLDLLLLAGSGLVFWASGRNQYTLVLAPEGVASISVNYWAFLGPGLLWLGAGLLSWRLSYLALAHGRRLLAGLVRPLTGSLARTTAAGISRQRQMLARAIVLVALALSFAGSTAVFNATYAQQSEVDARLTNGSDVAVVLSPGVSQGPGWAVTIARIPGVKAVEPLQHRFAYVGADLQDLFGVRAATIAATASLQDAYFQGGTSKQLMAALAARADALLVSSETVKDFQLSPGDLIRLRLQDARTKQFKAVDFHYVGIAKEFPTAPRDSFFVANADYIAKATGSDAVGTFLVDTGGRNVRSVANQLQAQLGVGATITSITNTRSTIGSSLTAVDLGGLTKVELAFALALAAGAGGLVLAVGLADRRRSFAIASVLGANRGQLRGMVLSEAAVVIVGGVVAGVIVGWSLSQMLVKVLTGVFDPPPDSLALPVGYLFTTVVVAIAAVVVAALVTARRSGTPAIEQLREL